MIEELLLENYRGASSPITLEFPKDKKLVVIFGENGTGKTTLIDAIDAIANKSGGSLSLKSSTSIKSHAPTIGRRAGEMRLGLKTNGKEFTATLNNNDFIVTPTDPISVCVLRRSNIQRFIESAPAARYQEIRHLLGTESAEAADVALKRAIDDLNTSLNTLVRRKVDSETQLERIWRAEGQPAGRAALEWAREESRLAVDALLEKARKLADVRDTIKQAESEQGNLLYYSKQIGEIRNRLQAIEAQIRNLSADEPSSGVGLLRVLEAARTYLDKDSERDACPVCDQSANRRDLLNAIQDRLEALHELKLLDKERESAAEELQTAEIIAETSLVTLLTLKPTLQQIAEEYGAPDPNDPLEDEEEHPNLLGDELEEIQYLLQLCQKIRIRVTNTEATLSQRAGRVNALRVALQEIDDSSAEATNLDRLLRAHERAHEIVRQTRLEFSQRILDSIRIEANRLYQAVHPEETLEISSLELDKKQKASLKQTVSFAGKDGLAPQAYFSEAHLDTLGFCLWMAFTKIQTIPEKTVIVLDDVFTSVDAPHMRRISELIAEESKSYSQVLITTHQRGWRDTFTNSHGPGRLTHLIELQAWSLGGGIRGYKTPLAVEALTQALQAAPFDRHAAASKAGILLEALLDRFTLNLQCRLLRKPAGDYSIGELLDGVQGSLKSLALEQPTLEGAEWTHAPICIDDLIGELRKLQFIRNQVGAHFNIQGAEVPDSDVKEFCALVLTLADTLTCSTCGQLPSRSRDQWLICTCPPDRAMRMRIKK